MFIAISKYIKPLSEVDALRSEHINYMNPYFSDGTLLMAGRQNPPTGAVIITKKATRQTFEDILRNDPYVKAGLAEYQILEFSPVLYDKYLSEMLSNQTKV